MWFRLDIRVSGKENILYTAKMKADLTIQP